MNCPLCNYSMDAFDAVCPRCKGKGLAAPPAQPPATPFQGPPPTVPSPATPPPLPQNTPTQVNPSSINPSSASVSWPTDDKYLFAFTGCAIAFCIGYLAPWITITSFFGLGQSAGVGGGMGLEFLVFLTAVAAAGVCWYEKFRLPNDITSQLRTALTAICVVFALSEALYIGFFSQIIPIGFGLPLMVIAAIAMAYLDVSHLPKANNSIVLPIACGALALSLAWSGYKGYDARKSFNSLLLPDAGFQPPSALRDDVDIKVNSVTTVTVLKPVSEFYKPIAPDPGKTFLDCNVTITFKGDTGTLNVQANTFSANASNKQVYKSSYFMNDFQNFKAISATLLPGGTVTGNVLFEVDSGAQIEKVEFSKW